MKALLVAFHIPHGNDSQEQTQRVEFDSGRERLLEVDSLNL